MSSEDDAIWTDAWQISVPTPSACLAASEYWAIGTGIPTGGVIIVDMRPGAARIHQCRGDHASAITAVAVADSIAASCSRDAIVFWDLRPGLTSFVGRVLPLDPFDSVVSCVFCRGGSVLAIVDESGAIRFVSSQSGMVLSTLRHRHCCAMAFAGEQFVSVGSDGSLNIWTKTDLTYQTMLPSASPANSVAVHPDTTRFAIATTDGHISLFDIISDAECRYLGRVNLFRMIEESRDTLEGVCPDDAAADDDDDALVMSMTVIGMTWLGPSSSLVIITTTAICVLNGDSLDLLAVKELAAIQSTCGIAASSDGSTITSLMAGAFSNTLVATQFHVRRFMRSSATTVTLGESYGIDDDLPEGSPLLNSTFSSRKLALGTHGAHCNGCHAWQG